VSTYARLSSTLRGILELLVRRLAGQQAYVIDAMREIDDADSTRIAATLNSDGFWGGSGSILDLIFPVPISKRGSGADDNIRLRAMLRALLEEMIVLQLANARAASRLASLRET